VLLSDLQAAFGQALSSPHDGGRAGWEKGDSSQQDVAQLRSARDAMQRQVHQDQQDLQLAQDQLAAAQKAQADMDHYQPAPPPVTVSNGITKAVDPLLSGAQASLATDQAALNLMYLLAYNASPGNFSIFGKSDERFHIAGGNDQLPTAIASYQARQRFDFVSPLLLSKSRAFSHELADAPSASQRRGMAPKSTT